MPTPPTDPDRAAAPSLSQVVESGAPGVKPGTADLDTLIASSVDANAYREDPTVSCLLKDLRRRHGNGVAAVLMYGSYLRGKRDTLLDFYVLLDDFHSTLPHAWHRLANRVLPPNVYYQHVALDGGEARSKYATLSLGQFERALRGDFHAYFWSRFTQPNALIFYRDAQSAERVRDALKFAAITFIEAVLPILPERFSSSDLWQKGFSLTYRAELRAEGSERISELYQTSANHFDGLCNAYARLPGARIEALENGQFRQRNASAQRQASLVWSLRIWQGKLLSALRIIKSAGTFDDPLDYLLWKIKRHSGIYIQPSNLQRRFPLVFAWPLLWRLYRLGAFR